MREKIYSQELEKEILLILENKRKFLSIREVTKELNNKGIKGSPQIIKRHLISLEKKGKITPR